MEYLRITMLTKNPFSRADRFIRSSLAVGLVVLSIIALCSPAQAQFNLFRRPTVSTPGPTAVVLDFTVAPRVSESRDCCTRRVSYKDREVQTESDSRGWWFGRQDIYVNANVGRMAADLLTDELRNQGTYNVRSRADLRYYYADKRDLIRRKFSQMSNEELQKAILVLDPVSIGRELGVQKVIVGHICDAEVRKAVMPGSFASAASLTVAVFDVASGRMEFEKCYAKIRYHSTQYFHMEKIAEEVTRDLIFHRAGSEATQRFQAPPRQ